MKLRVGIVRLGPQWESRYLPALRLLTDRFEVQGVCEQVTHRVERAAAAVGAVAVDGFRSLVARDDIDAILYLADQSYGASPILAACEHGKAVYSAISLHFNPAEAQQLRRRVDESGIAFVAELPRRHAPATVRLKELIATRLGRPRMLFCHRRICGYYMPRQWEEAVGFRPPPALQVVCENGIAFVDLPASLVWFDTAGRHQEAVESDRPVGEQMLLQFYCSVTSLVRHLRGLDDALEAMEIVRAASQSQA